MKTILVASRKGGCGKTTLCGHLAVQATLEGKKAAILDTDPQGSLADWWNERESEEPAFATADIPGIPAALEELRSAGFDYALIDTPPAITDALSALVEVSDLITLHLRGEQRHQESPSHRRGRDRTLSAREGCPFHHCPPAGLRREHDRWAHSPGTELEKSQRLGGFRAVAPVRRTRAALLPPRAKQRRRTRPPQRRRRARSPSRFQSRSTRASGCIR